MKPIIRDFFVGATAIVGVAGLVAGLIFFGEFSFDRHYTFKVRIANAGGVSQASRVTMNGVNIGQVTSADIMPPAQGGVLLGLKIKSTVQIPRKCEVGIDKGLIGDAALDFVPPKDLSPQDAADLIKPDDVFDGGSPVTMFDRLAGAIQEPLSKLTATAEKINKFADTYTTVGERFNDAIEPRTLADVAAGKQPNLRSALERLDTTLASANAWLSDEDIKKQVRAVIAKADTVMTDTQELVKTIRVAADNADKTIKTVGSAAAKAEEKIAVLSDRALSTLRSTEDAAGKLAEALETATKGSGTVGQLMQNPDLYNSLNDASQRLDSALTELQLLLEKFKAEGVRLRL